MVSVSLVVELVLTQNTVEFDLQAPAGWQGSSRGERQSQSR